MGSHTNIYSFKMSIYLVKKWFVPPPSCATCLLGYHCSLPKFNSIVDRPHMSTKAAFCSCFMVTILTTMFNLITDRLYMLSKVAFISCFRPSSLNTSFPVVLLAPESRGQGI